MPLQQPRRARVRALAKINLDLRVLHKRADGFHELRTIFQTISLADTLEITFTPSRKTQIHLEGSDIPDNLVVRAAEALGITGNIEFRLTKSVPIGAGLGGGSSDAATVLLALPVLAGRKIAPAELLRIAAQLGSDVPFFLFGGRALGIGRGTELYPLPDLPPLHGVLVPADVHVSTADAYRALGRGLTPDSQENKIVSFVGQAWSRSVGGGANDFESVVFEQFPQIAHYKRRLLKLGANPALMTGSGSAVFGLFRTREEAAHAIQPLGKRVIPISTVSRARFHALWWRWLAPHIEAKTWPPPSRYAR